jgi:pSer/pThr/pTyr-binding forkhead associated (FHA) protein
MPSPILPRAATLLEATACPLEKFDALFTTITETRQVGDGYFVQAHADGTRLLFVMSGFPYGVGLHTAEERAFLPVREFFTAYARSPESPLSFFAADKRLLLGLMVCFQHKPAAVFPESPSVDEVLGQIESRGGDAVVCLRAGDEWALALFAKGRPAVNYFPPPDHPPQMTSIPREQLQAYAGTMSPAAELYTETRIHPAPDVALLSGQAGTALTRIFLPEAAPAPAPPTVLEPDAPGPAPTDPEPPALCLEAEPEAEVPPAIVNASPAEPSGAAAELLAAPPGPAEAASRGPAPEVHLFVGERQVGTYSLAQGEITVGRTAGNTIIIENPGVSRRHAVLRLEGDRAVLEDLGSANGTFVNGQRVTRQELRDGDEIGVVKHRLLFRVPRGAGAGKPEPALDTQKTMFIDPGLAAQAVGRQPARAETQTPVLRPRLILPDLKKLPLEDQRELTLGTGADCDIVLSGMFVARLHAKVLPQKDGQFKIVHLAGLAATRVNGEKISEHVLKHGDEIEIGKQRILFRLER